MNSNLLAAGNAHNPLVGVDWQATDIHAPVQVRTRGKTRGTYKADDVAFLHMRAGRHVQLGHVNVNRADPLAMIHAHGAAM